MLSVLKAVVQLLVGELKSHKLHGIVKKKESKKKKKRHCPPPKKKKKKNNLFRKTKNYYSALLGLLTLTYLGSTEIIDISTSPSTLRVIQTVTSHQMFH